MKHKKEQYHIRYFSADLEAEAYEFEDLNLLTTGSVPEDCSVLMITTLAEDITEAERDAQIALAKGKAESIRLVYEAEAQGLETLKNAHIDENVVTLKKLEALKAVGDGRATKIFLPTELASTAATLGVAAEVLGTKGATPIDTTPKVKIQPPQEDVCCDDKNNK